MKKNECAQEMILDLVMRHGCKVELRPFHNTVENAVEVVISHKEARSSVVIDLPRLSYTNIPHEEIVCRSIERAAMELFRYPYDEMFKKHFKKEG